MAKHKGGSSVTHFLNVDLDIYSTHDLQPLINSFGTKVIALFVGRERRKFCAHLEVAKTTKSADSTIRTFCALVRGLPRTERDRWNAAKVRDFSIGIQAGRQPNPCDFALEAETVRAVSELSARIVITVYAPEQSNGRAIRRGGKAL
jgi:hypothetical protein